MKSYFRAVADRGKRIWLLVLLLLLIALLLPRIPVRHSAFDYIVVFDITQSMDVEDYELSQRPTSRLEMARFAAREALQRLPCGSHVGWAAFTGYRTLLLLAPVEVCSNYGDLLNSLTRVNGAMRWENASEITKGVYWAMRGAKQLPDHPDVIFITDGQEAPPLDPGNPLPMFEDLKPGQVHGWVLGAGGTTPQRIPKSDEDGNRIGFWQADEVMQRADAPAGRGPIQLEHLSGLREDHLRELAHQVGFEYQRLGDPQSLLRAMRDRRFSRPETERADLYWLPAAAALLVLIVRYWPVRGRARISGVAKSDAERTPVTPVYENGS
jgi:mxaL protein